MKRVSSLLTRTEFKELVFKRDNSTCVFCNKPAIDAHHILDRSLFEDGGYYLNNGASVCEDHHWACERTDISVEEVRSACGISEIVLPKMGHPSKVYDKWLNEVLENGTRVAGPLFYQENVRKVLGDKVWTLFVN